MKQGLNHHGTPTRPSVCAKNRRLCRGCVMTPSSNPSPVPLTVELFPQNRPKRPLLPEYLDSERTQLASARPKPSRTPPTRTSIGSPAPAFPAGGSGLPAGWRGIASGLDGVRLVLVLFTVILESATKQLGQERENSFIDAAGFRLSRPSDVEREFVWQLIDPLQDISKIVKAAHTVWAVVSLRSANSQQRTGAGPQLKRSKYQRCVRVDNVQLGSVLNIRCSCRLKLRVLNQHTRRSRTVFCPSSFWHPTFNLDTSSARRIKSSAVDARLSTAPDTGDLCHIYTVER